MTWFADAMPKSILDLLYFFKELHDSKKSDRYRYNKFVLLKPKYYITFSVESMIDGLVYVMKSNVPSFL